MVVSNDLGQFQNAGSQGPQSEYAATGEDENWIPGIIKSIEEILFVDVLVHR